MTLEEYLATAPPHEAPIARLVLAHVGTLPDAYVEPVQVGLFFKRSRTFAQLRTMTRWVALSLVLPRVVEDPQPSRKVQRTGDRHHHVFNLHVPIDVTPEICQLITEAYEADDR